MLLKFKNTNNWDWEGKRIKSKDGTERIEIRRTFRDACILVIVSMNGYLSNYSEGSDDDEDYIIKITANGPILFNWGLMREFNQVISEAKYLLS